MPQLWEHPETPSKVLPKRVREKTKAENKPLITHIPKLKTKHTDFDIKTFSALIT